MSKEIVLERQRERARKRERLVHGKSANILLFDY